MCIISGDPDIANPIALIVPTRTRGHKLDGHEPHVSLHAAQIAIASKIDNILMPSHTSHLYNHLMLECLVHSKLTLLLH